MLWPHSHAIANHFPIGHPSLHYSSSSTLNSGVLSGYAPEKTKEQVNTPQDLPPRLLFAHQIPGMVISTAEDGFNILMPYNIQNTLPDLAA
ncbi:unnamed protein product [Brassica oleracea var. botrytis]|uniref:Uncharacterized protein n=2 Tax=Brassica oleracea TaxID=3712 RepID=A0A0D3DMM0_BRAOL|nr:unnamed protein product [Brassica oleracea]